jgi:flagellar hook assembly protein FlgD
MMQDISLCIYDATGRQVKSFNPESSIMNHESMFSWDGTDDRGKRLPAGIYFVELNTPERSGSGKVVLLE